MNRDYNAYNIDLKIDVETQFIYSKVNMNYHCDVKSTRELNFYIHKDMEIEDITCDKKIKYKVGNDIAEGCPFITEGKLIKIIFDDFIYDNEVINIYFEYKGYINIVTEYGVNRLTKEWIELGLYSPWFPIDENIRQAIFKVKIDIDDEYKIINSKKLDNKSVINQYIPSGDCTIIASNTFKKIKGNIDDINLNVYFTEDRYKSLAEKINNYAKVILKTYISFGKVDSEEFSIVIAPREDGGGYCRPGLIVVTPEDSIVSEINYFKFIAHELAHLWWNKANSTIWEDWLNESFAEFSALIALRDTFGEEEFSNKIKIYEEKLKDLPPIRNLDRSDEKAFLVLYVKGPLILYQLEKKIGKEKFLALVNKIHTNNVDTTEKFLEKLDEVTNKEVKDSFNILLTK